MGKKIFSGLTLIVMLELFSIQLNAQIIFEAGYYMHHKLFYITDIGDNDYKYVIMDSSGFSIYNIDHSPFLINIISPVPLWQSPSYYEIAYVSKTLFDCDSTNIEYAITKGNYVSNFYIYRTDGTLLFQRDSVTGPYCAGCLDGSLYLKPIVNTPNGTKLFLQNNNFFDVDSTFIYSLCGTLTNSMIEVSPEDNYVQIFPNPTNGVVNFKINRPNNVEKFKLTIYNSSFQQVEEVNIRENNYQLDLSKHSLSSGTYLFDIRTEKKVYQTGKFIITK